jgi:hypothetical protein
VPTGTRRMPLYQDNEDNAYLKVEVELGGEEIREVQLELGHFGKVVVFSLLQKVILAIPVFVPYGFGNPDVPTVCSKIIMVSFPNAIAKANSLCQDTYSYAERGDVILQKMLAGRNTKAAEDLRSGRTHQHHHRS